MTAPAPPPTRSSRPSPGVPRPTSCARGSTPWCTWRSTPPSMAAYGPQFSASLGSGMQKETSAALAVVLMTQARHRPIWHPVQDGGVALGCQANAPRGSAVAQWFPCIWSASSEDVHIMAAYECPPQQTRPDSIPSADWGSTSSARLCHKSWQHHYSPDHTRASGLQGANSALISSVLRPTAEPMVA